MTLQAANGPRVPDDDNPTKRSDEMTNNNARRFTEDEVAFATAARSLTALRAAIDEACGTSGTDVDDDAGRIVAINGLKDTLQAIAIETASASKAASVAAIHADCVARLAGKTKQ